MRGGTTARPLHVAAWLLLLLIGLLCTTPSQARVLEGRVIGISDGDTLTLLVKKRTHKIRLAQIDAPEKKQAYGERAKQSLSELVYGQQVSADIETQDQYGRLIATIWMDGRNINLEQVQRGMAWVYVQYAHSAAMLEAERNASWAKLGLWAERNPVPPWEWRRTQRQQAQSSTTPATKRSSAPKRSEFRCGNKQSCQQMTSCAEAVFYLQQCGLTRLDGNGDGVPCAALCR